MHHDRSLGRSPLRLREVERKDFTAPAVLSQAECPFTPITIENISPLGLRFVSATPVEVGTLVEIRIGRRKPFSALVKWNRGDRYGCQFMRKKTGKLFEVEAPNADRATRLDALLRGWANRKAG